MKKINQIISKFFNQDTESFEEIYAFPEKLFHLFGNSFNLHFSEYILRDFIHSSGIYGEKRERAGLNVLKLFYMWFNLLLPVIYSIFAIYSFENLDDVHKIFETMIGMSASINVILNPECKHGDENNRSSLIALLSHQSLVKVLTYYRYGDDVRQLKRTAIDALNKYNRDDLPMEKGHAVKLLKIMR